MTSVFYFYSREEVHTLSGIKAIDQWRTQSFTFYVCIYWEVNAVFTDHLQTTLWSGDRLFNYFLGVTCLNLSQKILAQFFRCFSQSNEANDR